MSKYAGDQTQHFQYQKAVDHNKLKIAEIILRERSGPKAYEVAKDIIVQPEWTKKERSLLKSLNKLPRIQQRT